MAECEVAISYSDEKAEADGVLEELRESLEKATVSVNSLLDRVNSGELDTSHGLSFLEMKNHTMVSYLTDLARLVRRKVGGQSIVGDAAIERLVENRTVLERIRPIENKLRYQLDKMVRIATTGQLAEGDPLGFKARPDQLVSRVDAQKDSAGDSDDSGEQETTAAGQKSEAAKLSKRSAGVYVPPKLSAMHYSGDDTEETRRQRRLVAAKRRALSSSVMQELGREYLDIPEEVRELSDTYRHRTSRQEAERTKFEEDFMVRLPETKQERRKRNEMTTDWSLGGELTQHTDLSALDDVHAPSANKSQRRSTQKLRGSTKRKGNRKPRFSL